MDIREATRAVEVDNRIPLCYYFRVAYNLLKQADVFRDEKKIVDFYVMLLRFCSLISETIPLHQDYNGFDRETKRRYKKKLLHALEQLEGLKPKVEEELRKLNTLNIASYRQSKHASSSESSAAMTKGLRPAQDVQVPGQKYETMSFHIEQRVSYPGSPPRTSPRVSYSYHWHARKGHGASSSGNTMQTISPWRNMNCPATETLPEELISAPVPSAPPIENLAMADASIDSSSIHIPSADSLVTTVKNLNIKADEKRNNILPGSSCAICMDAPTEAACVPCGHMAGCMTCLNEIKNKNWGCPVCREKIEMVLRLFAA